MVNGARAATKRGRTMGEKIKIGISRLPRFLACGQSVAAPEDTGEPAINPTGPAAAMGRAVHEHMAHRVLGDDDATTNFAERYGVDQEEYDALCRRGDYLWETLLPNHPQAFPEHGVSVSIGEEIELQGVIDVCAIAGKVACIIDWKTGRSDRDPWAQLAGYGLAVARTLGREIEEVRLSVGNIRTGVAEPPERFTAADLDAFEAEILTAVRRRNTYVPGDHCQGCRRQFTCQAHLEMGRAAVAMLTATDAERIAETIPQLAADAKLPDLLAACSLAEKVAKVARSEVRRYVDANDRRVVQGDREIVLAERMRKKVASVSLAWPVLKEWLGSQMHEAVTISLTTAQDIVGSLAERGQKGKAKAALLAALNAAGAVDEIPYDVTTVRKIKEGATNGTD